MSIEVQGHFFTICFPGFVCFVLYWDKTSGERLQDHWSSGFATQGISLLLFLMIIKPILLRHLTQRLDDLLKFDNPYFKGMVNQIYPSEL